MQALADLYLKFPYCIGLLAFGNRFRKTYNNSEIFIHKLKKVGSFELFPGIKS
jgi:hypothetical protein